jgi:hypothetical protein
MKKERERVFVDTNEPLRDTTTYLTNENKLNYKHYSWILIFMILVSAVLFFIDKKETRNISQEERLIELQIEKTKLEIILLKQKIK